LKILKNIENKKTDKIWFFEVNKILNQEKFKVFYLSQENINIIIENELYGEIPDPQEFLIGFFFSPVLLNDSKINNCKKRNNIKHTQKKVFFKNLNFLADKEDFILDENKCMMETDKKINRIQNVHFYNKNH
jgi:hypothetical protein